MTEIKLNTFLKEKLNNFILYIEKTINKNNELYSQIILLKDDEVKLIKYAEYISKVSKVHTEKDCSSICEKIHLGNKKGMLYFEQSTILDFLKSQLKDVKIDELDGGNFIIKIQRYLELFINAICV